MFTQDHYNVHISITPSLADVSETIREFVYSVAELSTLLRTYGRVLSAMMRMVPTYSVRAYSPSGVLLGSQEWAWCAPAEKYTPVDAPWIPWRALPSAVQLGQPPDMAAVA